MTDYAATYDGSTDNDIYYADGSRTGSTRHTYHADGSLASTSNTFIPDAIALSGATAGNSVSGWRTHLAIRDRAMQTPSDTEQRHQEEINEAGTSKPRGMACPGKRLVSLGAIPGYQRSA